MESLQSQLENISISKKVFYIYDERMLLHKEHTPVKPENPDEKAHFIPEIPERISSIHDHLKEKGILDRMDKLEVEGLDEIETLLTLIHSQELVELVKKSCEKLEEFQSSHNINPQKGEIYECRETYQAALISASAAVTALKKVLQRQYERGYCIIRPPGHHAQHNLSSGFCFFNNVALAARIALEEPFNLKKVLIFDWDIHHGDGTQRMFYKDERVLFMSLHRCDNLTFYPLNADMRSEFIGEDKGKGFNINIPWETGLVVDEFDRMSNKVSELGNAEYRYACDTLLLPIAQEFEPELIIVSCGFDSAIHDFLGWSNISPIMYHYMTKRLSEIQPKVIVVQEGGYNIDYLGQHGEGVSSALLGDEVLKPTPADKDARIESIEDIKGENAKEWAKANVENTRKCLSGHWKAAP